MCNFNKQDEQARAFMHLFMTKAADSIGGANFLLAIIEAMKTKRPNPLMYKEKQISSNNTIIRSNKVVFADKVKVIEDILVAHRSADEPNFNILADVSDKKRKLIINMARTLAPIEFSVTPQNPNDGEGFNFKVFETIEDDKIILNPAFIAMFFCSTEYTKKALKYEI